RNACASASPRRPSAMVCRNYFRSRVVALRSGISWLALASARRPRRAFVLAPANFVLHLGVHRNHANFFPGRARQSLGVVPCFFSRCPPRPHARRTHTFTAPQRRNVSELGGDCTKRFS